MRAKIKQVFTNRKYKIRYSYVDTAKCRDDVEAVHHYHTLVPMMSIVVYNEDNSIREECDMFASPEIVRTYCAVDFFEILKDMGKYDSYEFSIHADYCFYSYEIEFELRTQEYPYLKSLVNLYDHRDELLAPIVTFPEILKISRKDNF